MNVFLQIKGSQRIWIGVSPRKASQGPARLKTDATTRKICISLTSGCSQHHCPGSPGHCKMSPPIQQQNLKTKSYSPKNWALSRGWTISLGERADLTKSSSSQPPNVQVSFLLIKQLKQVSHPASLSDIKQITVEMAEAKPCWGPQHKTILLLKMCIYLEHNNHFIFTLRKQNSDNRISKK